MAGEGELGRFIMDNRKEDYKELEIEAITKQDQSSGKWKVDLTIRRIGKDTIGFRNFQEKTKLFDGREEALNHGINLGRLIINGRVPGCSIQGL